jgi:bile acid:Na+ symporter, BASS family
VFTHKDALLLLTVFGSMGIGLGFPVLGGPFSPIITYLLMGVLFLSFIQIRFSEVSFSWQEKWLSLCLFSFIKLLLLPLPIFFLFLWLWPDYAIPALLLSGISTGVVAPFISGLVGAQTSFVLGLVVITSLGVPFSLPFLVKAVSGQVITISFRSMAGLLSLIIFFPAVCVVGLRKIAPRWLVPIESLRYPLSLVLFALINLGVFSRYQSFFRTRPLELANAILVAFFLSALFHGLGWFLHWGQPVEQRLAQAVSLAYINNVLVIVFASQFFGPLCPTLAAMYMLPFFSFIVPLRWLGRRTRS